MDINHEEEDPTVGMRMATNSTSTDHCAAFALDAKDLLTLRTLCDHVSDEEFTDSIAILVLGLTHLKEKAEQDQSELPVRAAVPPHIRNNTQHRPSTIQRFRDIQRSMADISSDDDEQIRDYEELIFLTAIILGCSIIDLDDVCSSIVELSTICLSNWESVGSTRNDPKKNRTINSFTDQEARSNTRFTTAELHRLKDGFFGTQSKDTFSFKGYKFTFEEVMLISLDYLANGHKYSTMRHVYGGDWGIYGLSINFFARFLHHKYFHRLSGDSLKYWAPQVPELRKAIWLKVCFDEKKHQDIHVAFDEFLVFLWIDDMQHEMSRPGGGPIDEEDNRRDNENQIQRAFFTRYGKMHGMKTQAVHCQME